MSSQRFLCHVEYEFTTLRFCIYFCQQSVQLEVRGPGVEKRSAVQKKRKSDSYPGLANKLLDRQECSIPHFRVRVCHQFHHTRFTAQVRYEPVSFCISLALIFSQNKTHFFPRS